MTIELTVYQGLAGDRNERGIEGAALVGAEIARRLDVAPHVVGSHTALVPGEWREQLDAAREDLTALAARLDDVLTRGSVPITAFNRCAAAIATLPIVARHHPNALVLWFDGHADINVPENSTTGYLGGIAFSASLGLWASGFGAGVAPENAVLVGARDIDEPEAQLIRAGAVQAVAVSDIEELESIVRGRDVYVHIDCDVLEPGQVPTEYSVPGGFTLAELHTISGMLAHSTIVGVEIGEFESRADDLDVAGDAALSADPLAAGSAAALTDALAPLFAGR